MKLDSAYGLFELIQASVGGMRNKEIRQLAVMPYSGLKFVIEYTDARTELIRFYKVDQGQKTLLGYFDKKTDKACVDQFYQRVRDVLDTLPSSNASSTATVMESGKVKAIEFKGNSNGRAFRIFTP